MKLDFHKNDGELTVSVDGRLDTVTAPALEQFLIEHRDGVGALTLDLGNLSYISSAGLRVLLGAHKRMKGAMKLIRVGEVVMDVLEMTGFADILVIE